MKVLITGANGFLGNNILRRLLSLNNEIYAVSLNTSRIGDILDKIKFSKCIINNIGEIETEIKAFSPTVVIHCAWDGGNSYSTINNNSQFDNNIPGIGSLMNIVSKCNIPHFIGMGSGAEYGNKSHSISEADLECPISLYGTCKLITKIYTEHFCNLHNIKWSWVRPFYTYGPNDVSTRLIPKVISSCLKKESVKLDDCNSIIDYLYIDDFVSAIVKLVNGNGRGVVNICSSNSYHIKDIILKIANLTDNVQNVEFGSIPNRNNYPPIIVGDNCYAKNILNWSPTIDIDVGLKTTIDFYKNI